MRKHFTLIVLVLLSSFSFMASAQSASTQSKSSKREVRGIHPWDVRENRRYRISKEDANWSLFLHGGFNVFDGDFNTNKGKEIKHSVYAPTVGLGFDYKFNPTWGLGMDYTFRQVGVNGNQDVVDMNNNPVNLDNLLKGYHHDASLYLSLDLFNLFFPKASTKLFALNLLFGGSFLAYRNTNQTPTLMRTRDGSGQWVNTPDQWKNKTGSKGYQLAYPEKIIDESGNEVNNPERYMDKYDFTGGFLGGFSFDFNVNRDIAIGLRTLYRLYLTDDLDGRNNIGTHDDGVFDTEILLRWKIQATKKSHVNNYVNKDMLTLAKGLHDEEEERKKDTIVIFHRDTINIFRYDSTEIFHKDTIVMQMGRDTTNIYNSSINYITNPESDNENYFYVYFDPDRYNLSDDALVVIQQVADRMEKEPSMYAAIIGYCDNVGSAEYNKRLGQNRSQNVYEELRYEHGVAEDRMFAISRGIVVGKRSSSQYAPNRRVEIRLVDRAFFNQLRAQYREDIELQKAFVKNRNAKK